MWEIRDLDDVRSGGPKVLCGISLKHVSEAVDKAILTRQSGDAFIMPASPSGQKAQGRAEVAPCAEGHPPLGQRSSRKDKHGKQAAGAICKAAVERWRT